MNPDLQLYLLYVAPDRSEEATLEFPGDAFPIADQLYLVRSELSRSRLYHRIKRQLPETAGLMVAPLADEPKFKHLRAGALKWLRDTRASLDEPAGRPR